MRYTGIYPPKLFYFYIIFFVTCAELPESLSSLFTKKKYVQFAVKLVKVYYFVLMYSNICRCGTSQGISFQSIQYREKKNDNNRETDRLKTTEKLLFVITKNEGQNDNCVIIMRRKQLWMPQMKHTLIRLTTDKCLKIPSIN